MQRCFWDVEGAVVPLAEYTVGFLRSVCRSRWCWIRDLERVVLGGQLCGLFVVAWLGVMKCI